jgi:hypothetical protein
MHTTVEPALTPDGRYLVVGSVRVYDLHDVLVPDPHRLSRDELYTLGQLLSGQTFQDSNLTVLASADWLRLWRSFREDRPDYHTLPPVRPVAVPPEKEDRVVYRGTWSVKDDELIQSSTEGAALLLFGEPGWTDYTLEVEVQVERGVGEVAAVVRVAGSQDMTIALVGGWKNTTHGILPMVRGRFQSAPTSKGSTEAGRWHRLRVEVRGRSCHLYLDGTRVAGHTSLTRMTGGIGLRTQDTAARFRKLKVTSAEGKVLFEGLPSLKRDPGP